MAETQFDVVWIGAGPGGYVGAIRCAQLGLKTAVIEKDKTLGGTCLNVGCIPSKALLDSSENYVNALHDFENHGIEVGDVKLNLKKMMERKTKIVSDLTGGVKYLMEKNKISHFEGYGKILSATEVEVKGADGKTQKLSTRYIVIATGSVPNELPNLPFDGKTIISSTEALSLEKVPEKMVVVGGGVIGLELGSVWQRLGSEVNVVEFGPMICGSMDQGIAKRLLQVLKKQGLKFFLKTKVLKAQKKGSKLEVQVESLDDQSQQSLEADIVLVAAGRRAFTEGLGLENVGLKVDSRGMVPVDDHLKTAVPNIFAIGDVVRGPMLAHKAEEEGVAVAETLAGLPGHVNYETVPSIVYTWPEVASVGQTEEQLKAAGISYNVGTFPFSPNGRAKALGSTDGQVKILADAKTDRLLGVHVLGPRASDLIAEAVMAMEFGGSAEDIARAFHGHPTLSEVMREAALAVDKRARQM